MENGTVPSSEDTMKIPLKASVAVFVAALSVSGSALAQSQPQKDESRNTASTNELTPATHALELTVGTGYEQGFGKFASGQPSLTDVGNAGGAVQIGVGYRLLPQLTLGVYGSGAEFGRGSQVDSSASLYSAAAGVQADWHFRPGGSALDPWISLGAGWRGYWIDQNAGKTSLQGMELGKLQVGLDYRLDRAIAISPVVGADLSTFFTQSTPESSGFHNLASPQVNTFFFAGLMGRFDLAAQSEHNQVASR
jgi:hypothetical protein